jgi:hypothetical protein
MISNGMAIALPCFICTDVFRCVLKGVFIRHCAPPIRYLILFAILSGLLSNVLTIIQLLLFLFL